MGEGINRFLRGIIEILTRGIPKKSQNISRRTKYNNNNNT
jgi:hypothetical protein